MIRCLYKGDFLGEAEDQVMAAISYTNSKPIFIYYLSLILFALGKSKEAILHLEKGLAIAPRLVKKFVELNPAILQNRQVVEIIARRKKK